MKKYVVKVVTIMAAVLFVSITVLELNAHARAGGSRSSGGGSRSYSRPASSSPQSSQPRQQAAPAPGQMQQPGGGFMRSMAGGIAGGMLGSMLFSSFAGAGAGATGGAGGGGIGLFGIILLAGGGYLIYRYIKKKRAESETAAYGQGAYQRGAVIPISGVPQYVEPVTDDVETGLAHIRQMDHSFDESRFNDLVMDNFFKIQGAWMNRDLSPVSGILTDEMKRIFQTDLDLLLRDKQINRLENIAVRNVEIAEVWQETGQDYITASIYANLLDYTTDELSGTVVSGSKSEPVKFEEFWTFTRPVGNNPWLLSGIGQK
ncbi:MAG: Tim44 domain-containing protein [Geobacteraceae bacterium]|nr:Tim44 domain-containing protein [Geobacteraceae bacterium]NTW81325.1 Tim44 domain-containing protein [Geobacteraceae bacterium]